MRGILARTIGATRLPAMQCLRAPAFTTRFKSTASPIRSDTAKSLAPPLPAPAPAAAPPPAPAPPVRFEHKLTPSADPFAPQLFAVFRLLGKQYKVTTDDLVMVPYMEKVDVGQVLTLPEVLLVGGRDFTLVGRPAVPGYKVTATVEEVTQTEKIVVFRRKRRKNYRRTTEHQDTVTILRINEIATC